MATKGFITDDFMLGSRTARRLYHEVAKELPIIDYHCHLSPAMIAQDHIFHDAYDLFFGGDHYKWRAMRSCGVSEEYVTGDAEGFLKWREWSRTLPLLFGNPLYHWTHLELLRYFKIDEPLCEENCAEVWQICNSHLTDDDFRARGLIRRSNVELLCTTDDPKDDLAHHAALASFETRVLPTFRPDKAVEIGQDSFLPYLAEIGVSTYHGLLGWLDERVAHFHRHGCRLSDHALESVPSALGDAAAVFDKRVGGAALTAEEVDVFRTALLRFLASRYTERGWVMQLRMGVLRNNNTKMYRALGADAGFDSMGDREVARPLARLLDLLSQDGSLPKTILYSLNPKDTYSLATLMGCFQGDGVPGKLQLGSGWWFNDQRDGMEAQIAALANLGALGTFVGMMTDSRSFVSYPRHEYFRRILCNWIGTRVDAMEYPNDHAMLDRIVRGICYENAKHYFGFDGV